ncbi:MAG: carbamoyl phosphate synthase large subunit, partial [Lachnospiraceae bacterium]|nr:carbamoyl phosphate synthase large subunit [Lachnospiraceae bacterium]
PMEGTVLISVNRKDKAEVAKVAKQFAEDGFNILATGKTYEIITEAGVKATLIKKLYEGRPNVLDAIENGEIDLIINSPVGKDSVNDDSYLRKAAVRKKIPYITTIAAASAAADGIRYMKSGAHNEIKSLQKLHSEITDM